MFNLHDPEQWVKKVFLEFYCSQGGTGENMVILEPRYLPFMQTENVALLLLLLMYYWRKRQFTYALENVS